MVSEPDKEAEAKNLNYHIMPAMLMNQLYRSTN